MAKPTTVPFKDFILKIQTSADGITPIVYEKPCGLKSQGINFTKSTKETQVPDCDDPDMAAAIERGVDSTSSTFTGDGVLAMEFLPDWWAFYTANGSKSCEITLTSPAPAPGGKWVGNYILTGFNVTSAQGEKVNVAVELLSDGETVWTPAP